MTRILQACGFVLASALAVLSCEREVVAVEGVHELGFATAHLTREELPDGTSAYATMVAFLPSGLARAARVYLYMHDVRMEPGSEADIYLAPADGSKLAPQHLLGSINAPPGGPTIISVATHEILDFDRDGVRRTPLTTLRGLAGVGFGLHVKRGAVSLERLVLSTAAPVVAGGSGERGQAH